MSRKRRSKITLLRRFSQGFFLFLFIWLFLRTTLIGENEVRSIGRLFLDLDPLVLLTTFLASGTVLKGMLLALLTVALTLVLGRVFCSWVCPLGTTFNLVSWLRREPARERLRTGVWNRWMRSKYLVLIGVLAAALTGLHLGGILDPIPLFYRTMTTSVYPAFVWGTDTLFTWFYNWDPGVGAVRITLLTEPVYAFLRDHALPYDPIVYRGGVLIGLFFTGLIGLALLRFRFWCRYVCPLGALLGVVAKVMRIEVHNDPELCINCNACVLDCHGACDPHLPGEWKREECFVCFNCRDRCPVGAISFRWRLFGRVRTLLGPLPERPPKGEKPAADTRVSEVTAAGSPAGKKAAVGEGEERPPDA